MIDLRCGSGHPDAPPPGRGQVPHQPPADACLQDAYAEGPSRAQALAAQDPVGEALSDRAARPGPGR
ncbi:hypothetical protein [Streptomyces mexicanus]|uniref:hypothetical protein n=1 Tax=Streptomyces mexicanus TaxID=178566 RepID=UPI003F69F300